MNQSFYDRFTIFENRFFKENIYAQMQPEDKPLPTYAESKASLPRPKYC